MNKREKEHLFNYLACAHVSSILKGQEDNGNFSPHAARHFFTSLATATCMMMENLEVDVNTGKKVSRMFLGEFLLRKIEFLTDPQKEWFKSKAVLTPFRPLLGNRTVADVKQLCLRMIIGAGFSGNPVEAWGSIEEQSRAACALIVPAGDESVNQDCLAGELCLYVSRFFGKLNGTQKEHEESVVHFFEREVLDYMVEEGIEIGKARFLRSRKAKAAGA